MTTTKPLSVNYWYTLTAILLLFCFQTSGQSVCENPPYLGTGGLEEICVVAYEGPGGNNARMYFRGPGTTAIPLPIIATIGDYDVDLIVSFTSSAVGMSLSVEGTVTRTGSGNGNLIIRADAGVGTPLPESGGDLELIGSATGTSAIAFGGAAGYARGADLEYFGFKHVIDEHTNQAGNYSTAILGSPVPEGAIAIANIMVLHLNDVGESITIPSTAGIGSWRRGAGPPPDTVKIKVWPLPEWGELIQIFPLPDTGEIIEVPPVPTPWPCWTWILLFLILFVWYLYLRKMKANLNGEEEEKFKE